MKNCFITILLLFAVSICVAQDILVLKNKKRILPPDTLSVKILRVYPDGKLLYYPYDKFAFTRKDSQALLHRKPIGRRGSKGADKSEIIKVKYDETLKHTIFFDEILEQEERAKKVAEQKEFGKKRNVFSIGAGLFAGAIYTSFSIPRDAAFAERGLDEDFTMNLQATYERIVANGSVGLRFTPLIVGLNHDFWGTGLGFRLYPKKQMSKNFYIGFDFIYNNRTAERMALPLDTLNKIVRYFLQNRNELFITPMQFGLAFAVKKDYLLDLSVALGPNILLGERGVYYQNQAYDLRPCPGFAQVRLLVGKKY